MFTQFRSQYPTGGIVSELVQIHEGNYVVRALVQIGGVTFASGMACAPTIELAEDRARMRSLALLGIEVTQPSPQPEALISAVAPSQLPTSAPEPQNGASAKLDPIAEAPKPKNTELSVAASAVFDRETVTPKTPASVPTTASPSFNAEASDFSATEDTETYPPEPEDFDLEPSNEEPEEAPTSQHSEPEEAPTLLATPEPVEAQLPTPIAEPEPTQPLPISYASVPSYEPVALDDDSFDFSEVSLSIEVELKRIGWTKKTESGYLKRIYGKQSRTILNNGELLEFLHYLQAYAQTTTELERLGWSNEQGSDYLEQTYSKKSRALLTCNELQGFLAFLKSQPTPNQTLF